MPWPDCAPCHSLPDGCGGNRPPSGQPNVPANSRQSGLQVPLAASSPRYLALTNIRRRSQSLPAATEDRHRPPSTPNRARTIALHCPYRPFRCCIVIPSVDLGLHHLTGRDPGSASGAQAASTSSLMIRANAQSKKTPRIMPIIGGVINPSK